MRAVLLAGGQGRRLYPYTQVLPKPLVPIGDMPIIEIVIRQLTAYGFDPITIAVGHQADLIMAVMQDGKKWGITINYSKEETPLNTIGPLRLIPDLNEPFLVMNGDLLTDFDYRTFYQDHIQSGTMASVAVYKRHVQLSLGVLTYNDDYRITSFVEKPTFDYDVSMGIYMFHPDVLEFIPPNQPFGFDELMQTLLDAKQTIRAYPFSGQWLDMGTPEDLERATSEFETNKSRYLPND